MLTVYLRTTEDRMEIGRGELRAQFECTDGLWKPLWMYQGERRMLRFSNHEWLSLGQTRPQASAWEILEDSGERVLVRFSGTDDYYGIPVRWSVKVGIDALWPGFSITTEILPSQTINLIECFSRLETPHDYDGSEDMLCMIGQSPVTCWRDNQLLTPLCNRHLSSRMRPEHAARSITPVRTPICCLRVGSEAQGDWRYITALGDWETCCLREIGVLPAVSEKGKRGYEILVGVLDWRCTDRLESTVFFEGGRSYRQSLSVAFSSELPGGALDRWYLGAFERSLRQHFYPREDSGAAADPATGKSCLADANQWLLNVFSGEGLPALYLPDKGIVDYAEGSCPNGGRYSHALLTPWLGALGYQAHVTRSEQAQEVCRRLIDPIAQTIEDTSPADWLFDATFCGLLPVLRYLTCFPDDRLHRVVRRAMERMNDAPSSSETPDSDWEHYGREAFRVEALLLAGQLSGDGGLLEAGEARLARLNATARDQFWRFGCAQGGGNTGAGGQVHPLAFGHAILSNLMAYQRTSEAKYMEMAGMFARYLVSICFSTFNSSDDPDFDSRGFANGDITGCERLIECSPVETSDSLRCIAYWLSFGPETVAAFYDVLWLLSRSFRGVFPAMRSRRTGIDVQGKRISIPKDALPTEAIDGQFPFVAYENPVRQTRLSPRASAEVLQNYLTFGGGLAACDNDRLLVLVPRAGGYDLSERVGRVVHVYNPTEAQEEALLAIRGLSAQREFEVVVGEKQISKSLPGDALSAVPVRVPPKQSVIVEVVPSRQPSDF